MEEVFRRVRGRVRLGGTQVSRDTQKRRHITLMVNFSTVTPGYETGSGFTKQPLLVLPHGRTRHPRQDECPFDTFKFCNTMNGSRSVEPLLPTSPCQSEVRSGECDVEEDGTDRRSKGWF